MAYDRTPLLLERVLDTFRHQINPSAIAGGERQVQRADAQMSRLNKLGGRLGSLKRGIFGASDRFKALQGKAEASKRAGLEKQNVPSTTAEAGKKAGAVRQFSLARQQFGAASKAAKGPEGASKHLASASERLKTGSGLSLSHRFKNLDTSKYDAETQREAQSAMNALRGG